MIKTYIFCGHLGSGKTENALNFSLTLPGKTYLCDLDFVNPYYRSREHKELFQEKGIEIVSSHYLTEHADIPGLNKKVSALFYQDEGNIILDVGGDDKGARILGRLINEIKRTAYRLFLVLNPLRPQTDSPQKVNKIKEAIERVSGLTFDSIVFNPNLSYSTDFETIKESIEAYPWKELPLKISYLAVKREIVNENREYFSNIAKKNNWEILELERFLLNPWEEI